MDLYYNINGQKVKAIQWDGSKEHGAEIAKEIDMDVRYDLTDGVLTMHIGGYDVTVANQFDFVYLNTTGVDVASYQTFMNKHVRATHQQVVVKQKSNQSFDEVCAPLINWLKRNEDKEGDYRVVVDSLGAELLFLEYANYKSK
jgi:uncharacterized protein YprB with RNaseH-like and TPR domain